MSDQDEIQDLPDQDTGATEQQDAASEASATAKPDSAQSSNAQDGTEDDSSLSVVRAVGDKAAAPSEGASSAQGEEAGQQADAEQTKKEPDDREFTDVPFHKHPRFQKVLGRMKAAETTAEKYNAVQNYMDSVGLSGEEGANALFIAGLMKTEPTKAWEALQPMLQDLLQRAGEVLPPDLEAEVAQGRMTRDGALRVARANAQVTNLQQRQTLEAQRTRQREVEDQANSFVTAAEDWEADRRTKDPNFEAKLPMIEREIAWLQRSEGRPDTTQGVKDQLKRAYEAANKQFRPAPPPVPQRRPMAPVRGGQVSGQAAPAQDSTLEIIRARNRGART